MAALLKQLTEEQAIRQDELKHTLVSPSLIISVSASKLCMIYFLFSCYTTII